MAVHDGGLKGMGPVAQAANISRAQHRPILTFMTAKQYRPQFLISCIFMLFQQFDGAPTTADQALGLDLPSVSPCKFWLGTCGHVCCWQGFADKCVAAGDLQTCALLLGMCRGMCRCASIMPGKRQHALPSNYAARAGGPYDVCVSDGRSGLMQASTLSSSSRPSCSGACQVVAKRRKYALPNSAVHTGGAKGRTVQTRTVQTGGRFPAGPGFLRHMLREPLTFAARF